MITINILRAIHKWLEPYKYDNEVEEPIKHRSTEKKHVKVRKLTKADKKPTELDAVKRGELGVQIITLNNALDSDIAFQRLDKSKSHIAYYYHSQDKHQIAVRFEAGSGFRFYKRNDLKRKSFKPLIYPMYQTYDKTHLIPVGFHGSENDSRLLVGWSSKLNRGSIKRHEDKVIHINKDHTVYWYVDIERKGKKGAFWTSTVWFEDGTVADKRKFYDKSQFHWEA